MAELSAEVEQAVVEAYQRGDRLLDIERTQGVSRSTIYWILAKNGVTPSRFKTKANVLSHAGRDETLAALYQLIQYQDRQLTVLQARLNSVVAWAQANHPDEMDAVKHLLG